jgi:hypothetical protein
MRGYASDGNPPVFREIPGARRTKLPFVAWFRALNGRVVSVDGIGVSGAADGAATVI